MSPIWVYVLAGVAVLLSIALGMALAALRFEWRRSDELGAACARWQERTDDARRQIDELHAAHREQLANMIAYGQPQGRKPAEVLDTAPPEDEVKIVEMEMNALTRYVQEQSPGISVEKAREEAARMLAVATGEGY